MSKENEMLEELKKIREILTPAPPPPPPKNMIEEFKRFIKTYKVMGLAVAFIMGIYVGNLISALVNDLVMPILTFIPGLSNWEALAIGDFRIGHFLSVLITFIIVAIVIFFIVKLTKRIGID
ncbi:MAG: MscL family protein [Candidatus Hodarchaeota archaeon]